MGLSDMKNNIDFRYEYSDLNLFQTRVEVLAGNFKGMILEFGKSVLAQWDDKNLFEFDFTVYKKPDNLGDEKFIKTAEVDNFLTDLLVSVIQARREDPQEINKMNEAGSIKGKQYSDIEIDNKFYNRGVFVV